jgi:hypothetical protein
MTSVKALLTSGVVTACFYADRPQDRPCCEGLGVVRYGPITLCGDCDRRRSAVGKGTAPVRLADPGALVDVIAARDARRRADLASAMPSARLGVQGTLGPPSERSSARLAKPPRSASTSPTSSPTAPSQTPPAIVDRISVISTVFEILASNA